MSDELLLSPHESALVDAIAARVLEFLDERDQPQPQPPKLVNAGELARMLGVTPSFVYEHAAELGAVRVGVGDRPRLRFDPEKAVKAWTAREAGESSQAPQPPVAAGVHTRRRRGAAQPDSDLLPVR